MTNRHHCCDKMQFFLEEKKVNINYFPQCREYSIGLKGGGGDQLLTFCPWCGSKLPQSLENVFFCFLKKMNIENASSPELPEEFKTDAWWKNRKL